MRGFFYGVFLILHYVYVLSNPVFIVEIRRMIMDFSKYDLKKASEIAKRYGSAALTEMAFNIQSMDLVDKGILLKSLKMSVKTKQGEVDRVQFAYEWYGRFSEVGASNIFGKGQDLPAMHWRSNAIASQMGGLNDEFGDFYTEMIIKEVVIDSPKMEM
jgi:hypothetical protein